MAKKNLKLYSLGEIEQIRRAYHNKCTCILMGHPAIQKHAIAAHPLIQNVVMSKVIDLFVEVCFFLSIPPEELQARKISEEDQAELARLVNEDSKIALGSPCDERMIKDVQSLMVLYYGISKITPEEFVRFAQYKDYRKIYEQMNPQN